MAAARTPATKASPPHRARALVERQRHGLFCTKEAMEAHTVPGEAFRPRRCSPAVLATESSLPGGGNSTASGEAADAEPLQLWRSPFLGSSPQTGQTMRIIA